MKWNRKIPSFIRNKYALTAIGFLVWITFFDQNNLITQFQYKMELGRLDEERKFYKDELIIIEEDLKELKSDPNTLEKFAREKYLMKRDDEELFVIVETE